MTKLGTSIERVRAIEQEAKALADDRARMVVVLPFNDMPEDVAERTVSAVTLPKKR